MTFRLVAIIEAPFLGPFFVIWQRLNLCLGCKALLEVRVVG